MPVRRFPEALMALFIFTACGSSSGGAADATIIPDTAGPGGDATIAVPDLPAFVAPAKNAIVGRVQALGGAPIEGVEVTTSEGGKAVTNYDGFYAIADVVPKAGIVVRFAHPGYVPSSRVATLVPDGRVMANVLLAPRTAARPIENGKVSLPHGSVAVGEGVAVGAGGKAPTGPVSVRITPIPIRGSAVAAAPGDFRAITKDGQTAQLETFAMADYQLTDADGSVLEIAAGKTARIEMLLPADTKLKAGDTVPAWHFDEASGTWKEEGSGTVQAASSDPTRLAFVADVTHFSTWNCDQEMNTTCIEGVVKLCDGTVAVAADLLAQGVDYDGTSSAMAGLDGTFCVPAKTGSSVTLAAAVGFPPSRLVATTTVQTGSQPSSCPGPCTHAEIVLPCTAQEAKVDCDDTYFAGCKSCVTGRVVDKRGKPQAAVLKASSGLSSFTVVTDALGRYCAPAALDTLATLTASGDQGRTGSVSLVPTKAGACPDCQTAPDLVLSEASTSGDQGELDFSACPQLAGGLSVTRVIANGTDPRLQSLDGGFASLERVGGSGNEPANWRLELDFLSKGRGSVEGAPVATVALQLEAAPTGATTWDVTAMPESATLRGQAWSAVGQLIGLGSERYEVGMQGSDPIGHGTIRLDNGFSAVGDKVTGSFSLVFEPGCGPKDASLRLDGTLDLVVRESGGLLPTGTMTEEDVKRWQCNLFGLLVWAVSMQGSDGAAQVLVDGTPLGAEPNPLSSVEYSWSEDKLALNWYSDGGMVSFIVEHPVSGTNPVKSGTLSITSQKDCLFSVKDGSVTLQGFEDTGTSRWFTGSFDIGYTKMSSFDGNCPDHRVTGQFGAAVCR